MGMRKTKKDIKRIIAHKRKENLSLIQYFL